MKYFTCDTCRQPVFFENTQCLNCDAVLGFVPEKQKITTLINDKEELWRGVEQQTDTQYYRKCRNYFENNVCNWMIPSESHDELCISCKLNRTIPDISNQENVIKWARLETAKRRLIYSLLQLKLPLKSKTESPNDGIAFDFLADSQTSTNEYEKVITGYEDGLITINIAEADDVMREQTRLHLDERYRTVLGHFRHEIGHYYWQLLINGTQDIDRFRAIFGDESIDYSEALQNHYENGPPDGWQTNYISKYASAHPWEDWAESWAHYLHIVDTTETASYFGITIDDFPDQKYDLPDNIDMNNQTHKTFLELINNWVPLTIALNSINRSMGLNDIYPFVQSKKVLIKLLYIHSTIEQAASYQNSTSLS